MQESRSGELQIDAPAEHVQWFLDYVHGTLKAIDGHMAAPLFQLADKYGVAGLSRHCEARLICDLSIENIPTVLELSDMHGNEELLRSCVAFVRASRCVVALTVGLSDCRGSANCCTTRVKTLKIRYLSRILHKATAPHSPANCFTTRENVVLQLPKDLRMLFY
jgi:hypothetical protein